MILPGMISHTKYSGLPLPLPMRTSAGLRDTGLSGKTRIQILPPRLMWRDRARRAASSWRAVSRPRPMALRPYSPKATLAPRVATPVLRPFCCFLYFVRDGCSMTPYSFFSPGLPSSLPATLRVRLTAVLGALAGAAALSAVLSAAVFSAPPSVFALAGARLAPALGAGFFERRGSDGGGSVCAAIGAVAGSSEGVSPLGTISPL